MRDTGRLKRVAMLLPLCVLLTLLRVEADRPIGAQTAQPPVFRSGVELVEVAVVVRGSDGRLLTGLTRADFEVLDDGVAQTVTAFNRVSIPIVRTASLPPQASIAPDVASNEHVAESRIFVLVLDALHVAPHRTRDVRKHARQFIEEFVGPGDLVAVASPGGLAAATQDFTSDKSRLLAAVDQFSGSKLRSATVERDAEARGIILHEGRDPADGERVDRARSLTNVLEALAGHLDRIEGRRKALLLFSEGSDYNVGDVMGVAERYASDVSTAMQRAVRALMRTNVSMYAIDPRGLSSAEGDRVEAPLFSQPAATNNLANPGVEGEYALSIRSLRDLAEPTGGFAAIDANSFGGAFARIVEESSDYYVLGFTPSKPSRPGQYREIAVRVSRPGAQVIARKGYMLATSASARASTLEPSPDAQPAWRPGRPAGRPGGMASIEAPAPVAAQNAKSNELTLLLASPLPRAGLPLRLQAIPFMGDAKKATVQIVVEILGKTLQFSERGGRFDERLDLAMLTIDDRARASNGKSATIDLHLTTAELDRVKQTGARWLSRIELPPGRHQIRVAGRALRSGTTGLITVDLDVPRFDVAGLGMSGITLTSLPSVLMVTRGESQLERTLKTPPSAARTFVAGDRITAAVEVYVPAGSRNALEVVGRLEPIDGSETTASSTRVAIPPGPARGEEVAFPFDTGSLRPGRYLLRIMLNASGTTQDRIERSVPVEIVGR